MERNNWKISWTFLPTQKFYPDAFIAPVTKVPSLEGGWWEARKTETYSSHEECHLLFAKHLNMEHVLWTEPKTKCTKHNCLLPWFKCFSSSASCLALLYLLRLSEQKKRTLQFKINILLWDKLCLLNLPRLELFAPATTCAWQLPYNSPWHNLHFPEG